MENKEAELVERIQNLTKELETTKHNATQWEAACGEWRKTWEATGAKLVALQEEQKQAVAAYESMKGMWEQARENEETAWEETRYLREAALELAAERGELLFKNDWAELKIGRLEETISGQADLIRSLRSINKGLQKVNEERKEDEGKSNG